MEQHHENGGLCHFKLSLMRKKLGKPNEHDCLLQLSM
jgi:hypothetical protein